MTKKDKLIDKIRNNPTNVRFETIQTILIDLGFKECNLRVALAIIHTP